MEQQKETETVLKDGRYCSIRRCVGRAQGACAPREFCADGEAQGCSPARIRAWYQRGQQQCDFLHRQWDVELWPSWSQCPGAGGMVVAEGLALPSAVSTYASSMTAVHFKHLFILWE